jgi:hypothetical protein
MEGACALFGEDEKHDDIVRSKPEDNDNQEFGQGEDNEPMPIGIFDSFDNLELLLPRNPL